MALDDAPSLETLADGTHRVRVRYGKARSRIRIPTTNRDLATARAAVLVDLGAQLGDVPPELARDLLEKAGAADGPGLERIKAAVAKLASGVKVRPVAVNPRALWSVEDLGKAWTKGDLAKEFPDQVKVRRSASDDVSRLRDHVYPVIGARRVRDITLADLERVMSSLKGKRRKQLSAGTRRHVALALNRLLSLAVYPLKIRETNPVPRQGFLPRKADRKALAYLYPSEDAQLLACAKVPIARRLLWGFLTREGCRVSEALALRWSDLDLERGAVRLDENKTDDPRAWALSPGVAAALARFEGEPGALVFEPPAEPERLATRLRADLEEAKISRPELFERTAARLALRAHDLRASFVTIALATGKSEAWVTDRTGHRSHEMVQRYRRAARQATELSLGDWTPLDVALGLVKPKARRAKKAAAKVETLANNDNARPARRDSKRDNSAHPIGFEPMTYGSGASNVRLVGSSKPSQGVESVRVGAGGRVQPSQGIAGPSSPFAAPVLQGATGHPVARAVERWLTVGEVAERLRVSMATVYTLCKRGQLRHVRVANAIRIDEAAVSAFLGRPA